MSRKQLGSKTHETRGAGYETTFESGWVLTVFPNEDSTMTARLGCRSHAFEVYSPEATMLGLPSFGFAIRVSFDQFGVPNVQWFHEANGDIFAWFCALGHAGWSTPVEGKRYA
ncbi:MAG TPA: hypothetical protein VGR29_04810 [Thermomicrobiales bacterium]|nr:hypothetical protein [Thermomicrobiales bacterium]